MIDNDVALAAILDQLSRIADAVEALAADKQPAAPNLVRDIAGFADFDWASIGAHVTGYDQFGPTMVEYRGQTYKRRSPENEYGAAIWYNRSIGKDEEGRNRYARLITFKEMRPAKPISRSAEALAATPKPPAHTAPSKPANGQRPSVSQRPIQPSPAASEEPPPWAVPDPDAEAEFEDLPSAAKQPAQAHALAQAAASRPAPAPANEPAGKLPFSDQGTAVKWATNNYAHYQKDDGSPDYAHAVGSHANLCKRLGCSDRNIECWGQAWLRHVQERAGG